MITVAVSLVAILLILGLIAPMLTFVWKLTLKAKIYISLKPTVSDPEGITIRGALHKLGFDNVKDVRAGKFIELDVEDGEESEIKQQVTEMCQKLLSNPIIEDFNFEIQNT